MTYLFKLARRLAFARSAAIAVLITACSQSTPRDFLGPEPGTPSASNTPVSLQIASHPGAVAHDGYLRFAAWGRNAAGDSIAVHVTWAASAGEIQPDGTFRATSPGQQTITAFATSRPSVKASTTVLVGEPGPIFTGLKILPEPVAVFGGNSVQFNATARLTVNGATTAPAVTWTTTGGTIDAQGRFVAPSAPGQYQVSAATLDGRLTATVGVTVKEEVLVQLRLNPKAAVIPGGGSQDFFVNAAWSSGATALPVLQWETEAGTIVPIAPGMGPMGSPGNGNGNAGGRLQGGTTPGTFKVIARHPHSGKSDTATVTILPTLAEFWLTPREVDLVPGAAVTFSAGGRMTDGQTVSVTPSWLATGGTITGSGVFTAGSQAGTFRVIASAGTGSLADTAIVRIAHPAATLSQVVISPRSGTQGTGAILQFGASATWSDGSTALPALVWSADAGTITADGRWTAPQVAGTVRVRVADASGTRADTAVITVQMTAPTLTSLRLAPAVAEVGDGQSVTFTPSATWSNGGTSVPSLVWSATGGAITQGGKWTAPVGHPGTYKVVARQAGGTLADTATVTVASVPQVTAITVSPSVAATAPKGTVQFAATATWSDGQPRAVSFVWQATGGTITANGLYTAGALAGQFLVVASCTGCPVADTVAVSVTEPVQEQAPVLTNLVLNPSAFTLAPGQTRALNVAASWSDGSTAVPPLSWEATGGTVSNLVYTAGQVAGSYRIIVRHQGGTRADTTAVTIGVAPLTVVSLAISPDPASVPAGFTLGFTATATMSDGSTQTPAVTWAATGGTISTGGVYTAGLVAGTFQVTATHGESGLNASRSVTITSSGGGSGNWVVPELPRVLLETGYVSPTGQVLNVAAGGNLQAALNAAQCGDEIRLERGASFTGAFVLPARNCAQNPIHLRTAGAIPPPGTRVSPTVASGNFARLVATSADAALKAAPNARGYRIIAVEITALPSVSLNYGLLRIGEANEASVNDLPGDVVLDRLYVHGHPNLQLQRCVALNGVRTAVVDSYLSECHMKGFDSQAIAGWAGPGPYKIVNNYLEGAGENIIFGGAPMRFGVGPADIEIRRNHLNKPVEWMTSGKWTVKNLFELKNAQRVLFEGNVLTNNWADGQAGFGILFQSLNDGAANSSVPATVRDVTVRNNRMEGSNSGINILAGAQYTGDGPVLPIARVLIENNLIDGIGRADRPGANRAIQLLSNLADVTLVHNTVLHARVVGIAVSLDGNKADRTAFHGNLLTPGEYGMFGNGGTVGTSALNKFVNAWVFSDNAVIGVPSSAYPPGNFYPAAMPSVLPTTAAGRPVGVDLPMLSAALAGVVQ